MTAPVATSPFVSVLCNDPARGPVCSQFLTPEEQARLAAACRATRALPRQEVGREWKVLHEEMSPDRWRSFSPIVPLPVQRFNSILARALLSPLFLTSSVTNLWRKLSMHCPREIVSRNHLASVLVDALAKVSPEQRNSPGIKHILREIADLLRHRHPRKLWESFQKIGPEVIAPGSPGCTVLEEALTERARAQTMPFGAGKLFPIGGATWWDPTEMPEPMQNAFINAVKSAGVSCAIMIAAPVLPSSTRGFAKKVAQLYPPVYVTGDAFLPTDAHYLLLGEAGKLFCTPPPLRNRDDAAFAEGL